MDRAALRRILLELVGTADRPDLARLTQADWAELDRIAGLHRLQPLLHAQLAQEPAIPPPLAAHWQAAHRFQAMQVMAQQADLADTSALLEREGFRPVALKGAWLARQAYPEAAQRPMRDIDLLVPAEVVVPAFTALLAAGYVQPEPAEMALAEIVRIDKHMPPLIAPHGTAIELHHRLWEREGRLDHASPHSDQAALLSRCEVAPDGLRFLAPQDLLAHLIIHAIYSHRLDCGPLVLSDIDFLLRTAPIDWPRFWIDAQEHGWREGARLLLELTARYRPNPAIDFSADPGEPAPAQLLAAAPDLLLQELDTRRSAGLAAATLKAGPVKLLERMAGRRSAQGEAPVTRQTQSEGGWIGWAGSRVLRSLRDLSHGDVRSQSRHLAALSRWLDQ